MSSEAIAIRVSNLSKRYEIYDTPRQRLKQFFFSALHRLVGCSSRQYYHEFWALQGIGFEVKRGETIGIIGRNGSGKSTLLQIICGTLTPTTGQIETVGRIAALLELGSGFNPDFTGRENIFLNAALLGLSNREINERYDAIIAFADIGEFIDQPVKTYSSGMIVRIAFAVIAHVDADVLIIDEALAVGDAIFNQKCMRFLRNFMSRGTIFFVSHDTSSVKNLCNRVIWLDKGKLIQSGDPKDVCYRYLQYTLQSFYGDEVKLDTLGSSSETLPSTENTKSDRPSNIVDYKVEASAVDNFHLASGFKSGAAEVVSLSMTKIDSPNDKSFLGGELVKVVMHAKAHQELASPILGFIVKDRLGQELFGENTYSLTKKEAIGVKPGQCFSAEFVFRFPMLQNGQYVVMSSLANGDPYDHVQHHYLHDALVINVYSSDIRFGIVGVSFESISLLMQEDVMEHSMRSSL